MKTKQKTAPPLIESTQAARETTPTAAPPTEPAVAGRPEGSPILFYVGLYEHGFNFARDNGTKKRSGDDEERLSGFAENSAKLQAAASYDPAGNAADRLAEERSQRDRAKLDELDREVAYARAASREEDKKLADLGERPVRPATPYLLGIGGALGIALTLSLTLHDLVFARLLPFPEQALVAAGVAGVVLAGLIVWAILASATHETKWLEEVFWVCVSLLFGVALLFMRAGAAQSDGDRFIAYGFAGVEVVSLLVVELFARGLRRKWQRFNEEAAAFAAQEQRALAARDFLADRLNDQATCQARCAEHEHTVGVREHLARSTPLVVEAARQTILLGYQHGIAGNNGYLQGASAERPAREQIMAMLSGRLGSHLLHPAK